MNSSSIYLETYGCQMNKLDSENVSAILVSEGFTMSSDWRTADVILLNTCGVREHAEGRILGRVTELSGIRREHPGGIFGIIGCMAQRLGAKLLSDSVRIVAGPDSYRKLGEMIRLAAEKSVVDTTLTKEETYEDVLPLRSGKFSAWVAIMRGCNNFCSYCVVPYTRGRERSIPVGRVITEVEQLRDRGYQEVTLLGQNVNSYSDGEIDFAELLQRVAGTGIPWIRFLTSHPKDLTESILAVMASHKNICNHLHLPLQSGSDRILEAMNRGYTMTKYLSLIEKAREIVPGISITTDLMFGFPGETVEDFQETLAVMREVKFDYAFLYRYSEREGTKAFTLGNNIPEYIRIDRLKEAITIQQSITRSRNTALIGTESDILVKEPSKDGKGWMGFTGANIPVVFTANGNSVGIGSFVRVKVNATTGASLVGEAI